LVCHPLSSTFPAAGTRALTPLLAFTGTDGVTTTPFVTHSHPFNKQLAKKVIFGVAVVFPVVITFGVDSPDVAHRPLCTGEQRSRC